MPAVFLLQLAIFEWLWQFQFRKINLDDLLVSNKNKTNLTGSGGITY